MFLLYCLNLCVRVCVCVCVRERERERERERDGMTSDIVVLDGTHDIL